MLISKRLRQAMIDAGYVHKDGRYVGQPNKAAFARDLERRAKKRGKDGKPLSTWERQVNLWTSEENPGGLSSEHAELAAGLLGISPEELKIHSLAEAAVEQGLETDALLREVLVRVESFEQRLQRLEAGLLGPRAVD